jgi:2-oxo-4-hydroxy-4-carboxy-5-ureidoimidazoline decarboxylase
MIEGGPFESMQHLIALADQCWWSSGEEVWREAFLAHPRIGDVNALKAKFAKNPDAWEGGEQSGADNASEDVIMALKRGNEEYEAKFGHIFLVCATGKSAKEMLNILQARMPNSAEAEILVAAGEQGKISHLRLHKLMTSHDTSRL